MKIEVDFEKVGDIVEMYPLYSNQKSFYGKAFNYYVRRNNRVHYMDYNILKSYNKFVACINFDGGIMRKSKPYLAFKLIISDINDITHTTRQHLDEFIRQKIGVADFKLTRNQIETACNRELYILVGDGKDIIIE